jgi:hypothetical protein
MSNAKYHQLQAKTLLELAQATKDPITAIELRKLAAHHTELAIAAERSMNGTPRIELE